MQMSQFVDEAQLNVRGGDGGTGAVSFRREGPVAKGGPNGGDGGPGGDVWLVADHNVASLLAFRDHPHRRADNGVHGKGKDLHGRRGQSLEINVPMGTAVFDLYTGDQAGEGRKSLAFALRFRATDRTLTEEETTAARDAAVALAAERTGAVQRS